MPEPSKARRSAPAAESSLPRVLFFPAYSWPKEFLRHRYRLSRGTSQMALLDLVRQRSEGCKANRGPGDTAPEWCWRFTTEEAAAEIGCDRTQILSDLKDAEKRGLLEVRPVGFAYECRIPFERWKAVNPDGSYVLPSILRGPQLVKADERESDDEPVSNDPGRPAAKSAPVRRQIAAMRAGAAPKPAKVERFVDEVVPQWDGPGEVKLELAWQDRKLTVSGTLTPNGVKEIREKVGSALPEGPVKASSELAAQIRQRAGLVVDDPGIARIAKALNGTVPVDFFLKHLAKGVKSLPDPQPAYAIYLAERQILPRWLGHRESEQQTRRRHEEAEPLTYDEYLERRPDRGRGALNGGALHQAYDRYVDAYREYVAGNASESDVLATFGR